MQILGSSRCIQNLLALIEKIAPTNASVLIQGETGTGKELLAQRIHAQSNRAHAPWISMNCGALSKELLESELFGHEKGAFTGAYTQKIGLCEAAHEGTLFLDEIGEMPLHLQVKLLRFLQEKEIYRVGSFSPQKVDVRIVSATHRHLEQEVSSGQFREDLLYRLNTIILEVPPLRERKEDIPLLWDFFLKKFHPNPPPISAKLLEILQNYHFPGNIRELQNIAQRFSLLSETEEMTSALLPMLLSPKKNVQETPSLRLEDLEKEHILKVLAYHQGNKTKTAESLGITIKTLYNKLHRYGIMGSQAL
jgi:two-component system response regulator HydG